MIPITPRLRDYFQLETLGAYLRNHDLFDIDGVLVDVDQIVRRRYRCDTKCCVHPVDNAACGGLDGDCCLGPEIRLTAEEQANILAHLPGILPFMAPEARRILETRLAKWRSEPGRALWRAVRVQGKATGHVALRRQPGTGGGCLFRFTGQEDGRPFARCAIHAYLLHTGRPLWGIKPMTCWVWPLALVPLYDGHLLLTLHTLETYMFTCEGRYHASRPCLQYQPPDAPAVYRTVEPELRQLFGDAFYEHLIQAIERGGPFWQPAGQEEHQS